MTTADLRESSVKVWRYVDTYFQANGYMPNQREIAAGCGFKASVSAMYHLERLELAGVIERVYGRKNTKLRGIKLQQRPPVSQ